MASRSALILLSIALTCYGNLLDYMAGGQAVISANASKGANSAPLNEELAYYKLNGSNGASDKLTHSFVRVSCGALMSVHHTDPEVFPDAGTAERPILTLNHGYPESAYIWRKLTSTLSKRVPLVVPDVSPC